MPDPIHVTPEVTVPASSLEMRMTRASGPGGQNVNKVASKVELRVDLSAILGLPEGARVRLERSTSNRRDALGRLVVVSQRTRDQSRNLEDARGKIRELVARALVVPKERRPTRATAASRERRLRLKVRTARQKRERARVREDED